MDRELLEALGQMIDEKLAPMQKSIDDLGVKLVSEVSRLETEITKIGGGLQDLRQEVAEVRQEVAEVRQEVAEVRQEVAEVRQEVVKINLTIENDIMRRLDSLFDGYVLIHENQHDQEHRIAALEIRVG